MPDLTSRVNLANHYYSYQVTRTVNVIEQSGDDGDVGDDVGIARYIAASSNEHKEIAQTAISEHAATPDPTRKLQID